ncbi:Regulator of chromosome condensation [Conglomerata obtusa]
MLLYGLGSNEFSQLSLSSKISQTNIPTQIGNFRNIDITKIACGWNHTLILLNQLVFSFGRLENGALGRDEKGQEILKVEGLDDIVDISCGESHSAALQENGDLYIWGTFDNFEGQTMYSSETCWHHEPRKIINDVAKIASSNNSVIIQKKNGNVFYYGGLYTDDVDSEQDQPRHLEVKSIKGAYRRFPVFDFLKASYNFFFGIADGKIYAFGIDMFGKISHWGNCILKEIVDDDIGKVVSEIQSCDVGNIHSLFLNKKGKLYIKGCRPIFKRGRFERFESYKVCTYMMNKVDLLACKNDACLCVKKNQLYTWGVNRYGELGHNENIIEKPKKVKFKFNEIVGIYAGENHILILTKDNPVSYQDEILPSVSVHLEKSEIPDISPKKKARIE